MKIHQLQVDGFGVWSALTLAPLEDGLNVFYGPNEAGKSTLLQFVRTVLYGFAPDRRRYLPPVHGGRPGGSLDVSGPHGRYQLERHESEDGNPRGELILTAADGTRQGEHFLKVLLAEVDESIFNNVFAISLHELQELATLSDAESAELLYKLTAGLDRVSLVDVLEALDTSRSQILSPDAGPCQLTSLLADRERLGTEIEQLEQAVRRYGRLAIERNQLDREIARLEEESAQAQRHTRLLEIALAIRPRWIQREALQAQLAALGPVAAVARVSVQRWQRSEQRAARLRQAIEQLEARRRQLRIERAALPIQENLWRQAARIEALGQQQSWIEGLQHQVQGLEQDLAVLQSELRGHCERLGVPTPAQGTAPLPISSKKIASLRPLARAAAAAKRKLAEGEQAETTAARTARGLSEQIVTALATQGEQDLTEAMERGSAEVSRLRRRMQVDERLTGLVRYQHELEQQSRDWLERQMMPTWIVLALGGVFMCGVVLLVLGLLLPTIASGTAAWSLSLLGLTGTLAAALVKIVLDRSHAQQLDACQKQTELLRLQIAQAREEREELDRQIPRGGGPISARLEKAESHLAALDELVPIEARRQAAQQEAEMAARRCAQLRQERSEARNRWRRALAANGMPQTLTGRQLRQWGRQADHLGQLQRRMSHCQEELDQRRRELAGVSERIVQMAGEAGLDCTDRDPLRLLQALSQGLAEQEAHVSRRQTLHQEGRQLRRNLARHQARLDRSRRRRRRWLRSLGLRNGRQLQELQAERAQAEGLQRQAEGLRQEIEAALGGQFSPADIEPLLKQDAEKIQALHDEQLQRATTLKRHLQERFERRGQLAEQMSLAAGDRRLPAKRFELGVLEQRIDQAIHRWQVVAVTSRILDDIRTNYEQHRQPETLLEASGYLERLTRGHYRRVWTPLGEQSLRVDDAKGRDHPVEQLSRGTREQLFLALRLALTAAYARRGAGLPLVLDDVLVNFDSQRAKAAAGVLRDFAAAGHQILVFTCHEHIYKLFISLHVPACELPSHSQGPSQPAVASPPPARRRRKSDAESEEPVADETEESPEDLVPIRTPKPRKPRQRKSQKSPPPEAIEPPEPIEEEPVAEDDAPWLDELRASFDKQDEAEDEEQDSGDTDDEVDEEESDSFQWEEGPDEEQDDDFDESEDEDEEAA